jgi:membrane-associated phospholipid phosphatase
MTRFERRQVPSVVVPAVAGAVLYGSARLARANAVGDSEERFFRRFNDAPDELHVPAWVIMQSGSLAGVFVAAAELGRRHRPRTAAAAAVAGTAVWAGVKLIKPLVGRGRPEHHLDSVSVRGQAQSGLGYPSGHAAVALTLALIAPRAATLPSRAAVMAFGGVIGSTRMYVGAHLPLDVAGGLAIGLLAGQATKSVLAACS